LIKDSDSDGKQRFQYSPTAFIIGDADGLFELVQLGTL
jgi:hypothetical protein